MKRLAMLATTAVAAMFGLGANAQAQDWQGFYWGASVNSTSGENDMSFTNGKSGHVGNADIDGFGAGVHAGHNWQNGDWVWGVELDANFLGVDGDTTTFGTKFKTKIDWSADARARLGYATGPVLIYGAAGVAASSAKFSANSLPGVSYDQDMVGWTAALGADWALDANWSLRGEWSHTDFGDHPTSFTVVANTVTLDTFSVGFNRKF